MDFFDEYRVIDVDTHVTEPPDVWTSRVASKWKDRVPRVERVGEHGLVARVPERTASLVRQMDRDGRNRRDALGPVVGHEGEVGVVEELGPTVRGQTGRVDPGRDQ